MTVFAWLAVGLLGGIAAAARFLVDAEVVARADTEFPLGIFAVNLSAALTLGFVAGVALHGTALTIVAGGGIGSYSTFSTWILDSHRLGVADRADLAWLNIGLSLLAGFVAVSLGHWLGTLV